jgi:UDP-GlcNAc3NAcA epimerase
MNKKIVTVIGARPQFIKAAPVSRALAGLSGFSEIIVHTGQHYDPLMSDVFFKELEIPEPACNLEVGGGSHGAQTGEMMMRLENVLQREEPDIVLIYGDTNSTLAAALTAVKLQIPVAHVEAGLRSFNRGMPEEINRIVADRLSSLLFSPTKTGVDNLKNEGIVENVFKTGDVMFDVALWAAERAGRTSSVLRDNKLAPERFMLATIHRQENTDDEQRLRTILTALKALNTTMDVVLPLHPRTDKMLKQFGLSDLTKNIQVIRPVGFLDMVDLERNAALIVTDSGGVQKEAYFHRVPCVTVRAQTEWVETVEAGWNVLVDSTDVGRIVDGANFMLSFTGERREIAEYGDGRAAADIASLVSEYCRR